VQDESGLRRTKTIKKEMPVHVSNVNLVDPKSQKGTKVGYAFTAMGFKVRVSKSTGTPIPKPER
jgi:large subunit ribosomal protein L24